MYDEYFEYDCPVQGIDFDVLPLPAYGSRIHCSACGQDHVVDENLGTAWRGAGDHYEEILVDEWKAKSVSA